MSDDAVVAEAELIAPVDELTWLHAHEYVPWGVHVSAAQEHKHSNPSPHAPVIHFGLSGAKTALVNDHIAVVVGGRDHPVDHYAYSSRLDLFDTRQDKWLTHYDVKGELLRRIGHSVVTIGGRRAVVFGGEAIEDTGLDLPCLSDCYEITFAQGVIQCSPILTPESSEGSMPSERAWHSACAITVGACDAMLVLGGRDASGKFLGDLWALVFEEKPVEPVDTGRGVDVKWVQITPTGTGPLPLAYHSAVSVDSGAKVVVVGGRQSARGAMLEAVHVLDIAANAWTQVTLSTPYPPGWTARSGLTVLEVCVPLDEATGQLAQIMAGYKTEKVEIVDDTTEAAEPSPSGPTHARRILIFGGFSERAPVSDPTRFALLDKDTGVLREIHAPSVGLTACMSQASLVSADAKSLYIFGGIDARTRQFVATTNAIHFWKPQPGDDATGNNHDDDANAIRTKIYDNGDEYNGEMDPLGLVRHGQGRCVYHDSGGVYEGEWRDDARSGQGVMTYANGDTYAGQWEADQRHGFGILEIHSGGDRTRTETRYDGQWERDRRTGKGVVSFSDGSKLEGEWKDGKMVLETCRLENYDDGNGVCTYTGEVRDGLPHGQGESQHARETYAGGWLLGKRSGHGVSTLFDGTTYTGDWKNGKRNGFGQCVYARSRDRYDGKWVGGVRCGRGVCHYANGAQYDGDWQDDKCHGLGTYTFADGTFYQGNWKENKFCGDGALVLDLDEPPAIE